MSLEVFACEELTFQKVHLNLFQKYIFDYITKNVSSSDLQLHMSRAGLCRVARISTCLQFDFCTVNKGPRTIGQNKNHPVTFKKTEYNIAITLT